MGAAEPSSGPGTANPVKIFANIFISFIGAGVLGLPYAFKEAGILESTLIMAFVGSISVKAMLLLVDCKYQILESSKKEEYMVGMREDGLYSDAAAKDAEKQDFLKNEEQLNTRIKQSTFVVARDLSYGDIGYEAVGASGKLLVDLVIVLSQMGFCCGYLIFICSNLSDFVPDVPVQQWLLMILPPLSLLTLLRHLSSLAITSMLAQWSNLVAFGVVFWFDFEHFHKISMHPREISLENLPFFFVIAIYCYEGAGLILSLENSVAKEKRHKFTKYFVLTMFVVTTLYIVFGTCGYLSFGPETNQIITLNLPKGLGLDFSLLVKIFLCVAMFCTYPVMMFPVAKILEHYFFVDSNSSMWKGNILRGLVVLLTGTVVMVIPNFADLMALVGASCCTLLAFIMPGLFHLRLFKGQLSRREAMFDCFLIALGVVSTVLGLWDAMHRLGKPHEKVGLDLPVVDTDQMNITDHLVGITKSLAHTVTPNLVPAETQGLDAGSDLGLTTPTSILKLLENFKARNKLGNS